MDMLKSEQFVRDTFSKYINGSWTFHLNGMIDSVDTKIQREFGSSPERSCIWAHYRGFIFGSPYINMVFDDRYHSKAKVRKKFSRKEVWINGLEEEIKNFSLRPNDSISFEDNFGNKYELIPCAYERSTVIYFSKDGKMCLVYHEGNFELDEDTKSNLKKDVRFNMKNLLERLKENGGVTFNSGRLRITDDNLEPVDVEYVKDRLSRLKEGDLIHNKFGRISRHIEVDIDKYNKGIIRVIDYQNKDINVYNYYPIGKFEGLTVFATSDIDYFKISCMMVNLEEDRPDFILSDDNFIDPFYEFTIEQDSDWILEKLSDPLLKDYIREEFDYRDRMDAFIYYLRYLVTKEDHDNWITISEEAESFFEGDDEVEYLENGFYSYLYDKFIGENSVFSDMSHEDKLKWLKRYKFVTIYGNEVELKDSKYSNVPCFKIYKG
jgi:hypothetical protein